MKSEELRARWIRPVCNGYANVAVWDDMADRFDRFPLPEWDKDPFLIQLDSEVEFSKDMTVLDIGCGAGGYCIALAERAGHVTGIDISPEMITCAENKAHSAGVDNVSFQCGDFDDMPLEGHFDLVFAHMTPAIADARTFEKMLALSSDYCYLVKPTRRTDSVLDALKVIVTDCSHRDGPDVGVPCAFGMLWEMGKLPSVGYRPTVWKMTRPLDEAKDWYVNKLLVGHALTDEMRKRVHAHLDDVSADGRVTEVVHTTIATMGWRMQA